MRDGQPDTNAIRALVKRIGWLLDHPRNIRESDRREVATALDALLAALAQERDAAVERVAEALYERAMDERRTFSREPSKFSRRWRDEPYVPPFDGTSRPTNWRDQWRDEARAVLAVSGQCSHPPQDRDEHGVCETCARWPMSGQEPPADRNEQT